MLFGGKSPINDQCRSLLTALTNELRSRGLWLPLYQGNRNCTPTFMTNCARSSETVIGGYLSWSPAPTRRTPRVGSIGRTCLTLYRALKSRSTGSVTMPTTLASFKRRWTPHFGRSSRLGNEQRRPGWSL